MNRIIVGIDPGKGGGFCWLDERGVIQKLALMPTTVVKKKVYDYFAILDYLRGTSALVVIEEQQCMGIRSPLTNFSLGFGYGLLIMTVVAFNLRYDTIRPKHWQKAILSPHDGVKHDTKKLALDFAKRRWPGQKWSIPGSKRATAVQDGLVDAACIAEFGRLHLL